MKYDIQNYDEFVKELANTLDEVLTFEIRRKAVYAFKNSVNYRSSLKCMHDNSDGNKSLRRFEKLFHYDSDFFSDIIGSKIVIDGKQKRYIADVLKYLREHSKYLHFTGKKNVAYESGKEFSHKAFILIKEHAIDRIFKDKTFGLVASCHYGKTARAIIHSKILETVMTKKQKEQYEKEYAEGKHALTLDDYIKTLRKEKRQADKRRMTIAKKAARQTLAEYAALQVKVQQLETQIKDKTAEMEARLAEKDEEIANLKSAGQAVRAKKRIEYADLPETFPEDPMELEALYASMSDDCKSKLDAEFEAEAMTFAQKYPGYPEYDVKTQRMYGAA